MTPGLTGPVTEVVAGLGAWQDHDVYLCGPPAMVRSGLDTLEQAGIPPRAVHFDPWPLNRALEDPVP